MLCFCVIQRITLCDIWSRVQTSPWRRAKPVHALLHKNKKIKNKKAEVNLESPVVGILILEGGGGGGVIYLPIHPLFSAPVPPVGQLHELPAKEATECSEATNQQAAVQPGAGQCGSGSALFIYFDGRTDSLAIVQLLATQRHIIQGFKQK